MRIVIIMFNISTFGISKNNISLNMMEPFWVLSLGNFSYFIRNETMDFIGGFHLTLCKYQSKHHLALLAFLAFNLLFINELTCTTHNAHLLLCDAICFDVTF